MITTNSVVELHKNLSKNEQHSLSAEAKDMAKELENAVFTAQSTLAKISKSRSESKFH